MTERDKREPALEMPQLDHNAWEHEMEEYEAEGKEVADWSEIKEESDEYSWQGAACRRRLPGGGNNPKGGKR